MSNKSFWGKLATKNKKSAYDVSKETGIDESKVKEVFAGERELPSKHVDAVVKSIQSKGNLDEVDYLNAKRFFEVENFLSLRNRFGYGTQRSLANTLNIPSCYVSNAENGKLTSVPKHVLVKMYDFFQDDLNVRVKPIKSKKGRKKRKSSAMVNSVISVSTLDGSVSYKNKEFCYSIPKDFDVEALFSTLKTCTADNVIRLYRCLDDYINGK